MQLGSDGAEVEPVSADLVGQHVAHADIEPKVATGDVIYTLENTSKELKAACREVGISVHGSKAKLLERLRAYYTDLEARLAADTASKLFKEQERPAAQPPKPRIPNRAERELHDLTHVPYQSWCEVCTMSRGKEDKFAGISDEQAERPRPVVQLDFGYGRTAPAGNDGEATGAVQAEEDDPSELGKMLVATDSHTKSLIAVAVSGKGAQSLRQCTEAIVRHSMQLGFGGLVVQADGEPSTKQLLKSVQEARRRLGLSTEIRLSGTDQHQSNGAAERAIQTIRRLANTYRKSLEQKIEAQAAAHFPQLSTRFVKVWKLKEKWYRRARLVARQYKWATDMALWETFSPASTSAGVRLLIVASQLMQTPIFTADVRDAYLNVPQPEDQPVAISSPKSWGDPPQYWQLMKYLPGQRAAASGWFAWATSILYGADLENMKITGTEKKKPRSAVGILMYISNERPDVQHERVQCRDISVRAIGTVFNPSDVGTKVLSVQRLRLLCYIMGIRDSGDNPVGFAEYEMAVYDRIAKRAQQVIACKSSKALTATLFAILARGSEGADMTEKEADVQSDSFFIGICMIVGFALFGFYTFCVKLFQYLQQMCEKRRLRLMDQMPEETVDFSRSKEMEMYVNMVLVTPNGRHYHMSHCKWLDGRSTTRVHESDAVAAHYKKCHTCFSLRVVTKRSKRHGAAASSASAE
ncbi:unnamed protein product [Effrenium voratum]|nr:unnamed protein product [Effrenium voratum]